MSETLLDVGNTGRVGWNGALYRIVCSILGIMGLVKKTWGEPVREVVENLTKHKSKYPTHIQFYLKWIPETFEPKYNWITGLSFKKIPGRWTMMVRNIYG